MPRSPGIAQHLSTVTNGVGDPKQSICYQALAPALSLRDQCNRRCGGDGGVLGVRFQPTRDATARKMVRTKRPEPQTCALLTRLMHPTLAVLRPDPFNDALFGFESKSPDFVVRDWSRHWLYADTQFPVPVPWYGEFV
jgi:hypothetical protein